MMTVSKIKKAQEKEFERIWNDFVSRMNSRKKPFILRVFGSKYPDNERDISIAKMFFNDGFYEGNMFMAKQTK